MHLVAKTINGSEYYYLVRKERRGARVVTAQTIYVGSREKLAQLAVQGACSSLPEAFRAQEIGASLALVRAAQSLDLERIIDAVVPRRPGAAGVGRQLLIAAIHRAAAPVRRRSKSALREWYGGSALCELLPYEEAALDHRRVCETLLSLKPAQIDAIEERVVAQLVAREGLSLESLAFDTSNFDSWVGARSKSRLLRRGHAKSGRPLRVLGFGLLVGEDDLPLLTFTYPGNENDQKAFGRFLRVLDRRMATLKLPLQATVAADGGNVSRQMVLKLEKRHRSYVVRLPRAHAKALERTGRKDLIALGGRFKGKVWALRHRTEVYGKLRCVLDVYSKRMRDKQLPGLRRDARRTRGLLEALEARLDRDREGRTRGRRATREIAVRRLAEALDREHMKDLFEARIVDRDAGLALDWHERAEGWDHLEDFVLGRTLLLTDRADWTPEQMVHAVRQQSRNEAMFRDLKDPSAVCMRPLRHRKDAALRGHALVVVLGLVLGRLLVRRARRAGAPVPGMPALLDTLRSITRARMLPGPNAAPAVRGAARSAWIPCERNERQNKLLAALGLAASPELGATSGNSPVRARRGSARRKATQPGGSR